MHASLLFRVSIVDIYIYVHKCMTLMNMGFMHTCVNVCMQHYGSKMFVFENCYLNAMKLTKKQMENLFLLNVDMKNKEEPTARSIDHR